MCLGAFLSLRSHPQDRISHLNTFLVMICFKNTHISRLMPINRVSESIRILDIAEKQIDIPYLISFHLMCTNVMYDGKLSNCDTLVYAVKAVQKSQITRSAEWSIPMQRAAIETCTPSRWRYIWLRSYWRRTLHRCNPSFSTRAAKISCSVKVGAKMIGREEIRILIRLHERSSAKNNGMFNHHLMSAFYLIIAVEFITFLIAGSRGLYFLVFQVRIKLDITPPTIRYIFDLCRLPLLLALTCS